MSGNFNPRPPRGGGDRRRPCPSSSRLISIHAPARGGDQPPELVFVVFIVFQSTPPRGGATDRPDLASFHHGISIHAPARGGDPPCHRRFGSSKISIHAPARGGDSKDAQFYLRIFDKQVELLRFLGKMRGGCLRNPEKDRRFLGKSLANLPEISGHLDFAGA